MITEQDIDDLIVHLNIHYDDSEVPLSASDTDLILDALDQYKETIKKNGIQ